MAHAGSRDWTHNHSDQTPCSRCAVGYSDHHQWYYPTFMNGDSEMEQALCDGCWALKAAEKRFSELPMPQKRMLVDHIMEMMDKIEPYEVGGEAVKRSDLFEKWKILGKRPDAIIVDDVDF